MDRIRRRDFANWFSNKILKDRVNDPNLRKLSHKPCIQVLCYQGYDVNGFKFRTDRPDHPRATVNSGVCVQGEFTTDNTPCEYYGVLQEVVEVDYDGKKVVLFNCHWFDIDKGINHDRQHGIVEVKHTSSLKTYDLFIFASQANQVCYLPYASEKAIRRHWWVAIKIKRKGNLGVEENDESYEFFQEDRPDCPISPVTEGQDVDWDSVLQTLEPAVEDEDGGEEIDPEQQENQQEIEVEDDDEYDDDW